MHSVTTANALKTIVWQSQNVVSKCLQIGNCDTIYDQAINQLINCLHKSPVV